MRTTAIALAAVLSTAIGLSHCGRGVTPEAMFTEAESLRAGYEKHASERALVLYRTAVQAWQESDVRHAARAAHGLGTTYQQLGLLAQAVAAYTEALRFAERSSDRSIEAEVRSDLGYLQTWIGDSAAALDDAERNCQHALTLSQRAADSRLEAKALGCVGETIYFRGQGFERALVMQEQSEAAAEKAGDLRGVAQARLAQGQLYSDLRRFEPARDALEGAHAAFETAGDRRGFAITLVAEARLLERRGEYQASLAAYRRAEGILHQMGDAVWEGSCLAGQAQIHQYLADSPQALEYFRSALRVAQGSGLNVFVMDMLTALGEAQLTAGDEAAALASFEHADRLAVDLANPRWQAWAQRYIGAVRLSRRELESARQAFQNALSLLPGLDEQWLEAQVLTGLGEIAEASGRGTEAHGHFRDALRVSVASGDRVRAARGRFSLGGLEARQGRLAAARAELRSAVRDYEQLFGGEHPLSAEARVALASVDYLSGATRSALLASIAAERISLDHLKFVVRYLPERQALAFSSRRARGLDLAVSAALSGSAAEVVRVFELVSQSRGIVLDELVARRRLESTVEPTSTGLHADVSRARQRFANLLVRSFETASSSELEEARHGMEEAERTLAKQSAATRAEADRLPPGGAAIREALPPASALVSFVQYERSQRLSERQRSPRNAPVPSFAAFILRADRPGAALVPLSDVADVERLISEWRAEVAAGPLRAPDADRSDVALRAAGSRLRRAIWDPLTKHLTGTSRVFVVPDGALGIVPLAALPAGSTSYLLEEAPPIHYLSAERDLVTSSSRPSVSAGGMLAFGGPAFDDAALAGDGTAMTGEPRAAGDAVTRGIKAGCVSLQSLRFQPLDGTLQEVHELSGVWTRSTGSATNTSRVLIGAQASESTFKQDASRHRVLHLATHGFFLNGNCALAPSGTRGVGGLTSAGALRPAENPLLLSGLALAGANRRASAAPDEDDGILTAEEVAALDLSGVEWAVLSACDTGVGEIRAGEGVFGLRRAFQVAGARTVVMSLWSVDDQATRAWMRALYEGRFQRQLSTADAVHEASLSMLRDRRAKGLSTHPFYWAAFVAAGDWR